MRQRKWGNSLPCSVGWVIAEHFLSFQKQMSYSLVVTPHSTLCLYGFACSGYFNEIIHYVAFLRLAFFTWHDV